MRIPIVQSKVRKKSISGRARRVRRKLQVAVHHVPSIWGVCTSATIQVASMLLALVVYLRLHGVNVFALSDCTAKSFGEFNYATSNIGFATTVEVMFGCAIATTLRWLHIGVNASRKGEFQLARHVVDWGEDFVSSPIIAAVIVYALRTPRISFGQSVNLSLDTAEIGWFFFLGFLMGFFGQSPRMILNEIRMRLFPPRLNNHSDAMKGGKDRNSYKPGSGSMTLGTATKPIQ